MPLTLDRPEPGKISGDICKSAEWLRDPGRGFPQRSLFNVVRFAFDIVRFAEVLADSRSVDPPAEKFSGTSRGKIYGNRMDGVCRMCGPTS